MLSNFLLICYGNCYGNEILSQLLIRSQQSWDGEKLPNYKVGQPEITILKVIIPAGARLKMHYHPVINAGVLLKGELKVVTKEGKSLLLRAGDPIVEVVNTLHYGVNEGNEDAEIVVFYAGIAGEPITLYAE